MPDQRRVFAVFGALVCLAFIVHILLAAVIIVEPEAGRTNPVLKFYRRFAVLGPFFQESRITSKSHLMVRQLKDGAWTPPTDYACEDTGNHEGSRYSALHRRSFEVFLNEHVAQATREKDRTKALQELEEYFRSQDTFSDADSIDVLSVRRGTVEGGSHLTIGYQHKFRR